MLTAKLSSNSLAEWRITMIILTLPQADGASIHSINSQHFERSICFKNGRFYAVILASYYGGKGYTTHSSAESAAKMAHRLDKEDYSYTIIDSKGNKYFKNYDNCGDLILSAVCDEDLLECGISELKRFKCTWDRAGKSTDFIFLAEDAEDALYKLKSKCTTIGSTRVKQYDADTRGKVWQDLEVKQTGGSVYVRLAS